MKRIFAFIALLSVATIASAQSFEQAGVYDKTGNIVSAEAEPSVVGVELRVEVERFEPGVYARYAQKYLGKRAMLSERTSVKILSGALSQGKIEPYAAEPAEPKVEPSELPLPINRFSSAAHTTEEQAASTAELIFSLRKHRLDLITGEAGENVFGAGLRDALDEIAKMEQQCLEMFYGKSVSEQQNHYFNITLSADKSEYMVCRVSEAMGVVADDDLSGKPVVLRIKTEPSKIKLEPVGVKDKVSAEYVVVPATECTLIAENRALDSERYTFDLFAKSQVAKPLY